MGTPYGGECDVERPSWCPAVTIIGNQPSELPLTVSWDEDADEAASVMVDALNGSGCWQSVIEQVEREGDVVIIVDAALDGAPPSLVVDIGEVVVVRIAPGLAHGPRNIAVDALVRMVSRNALGIDGVTRECPRTEDLSGT